MPKIIFWNTVTSSSFLLRITFVLKTIQQRCIQKNRKHVRRSFHENINGQKRLKEIVTLDQIEISVIWDSTIMFQCLLTILMLPLFWSLVQKSVSWFSLRFSCLVSACRETACEVSEMVGTLVHVSNQINCDCMEYARIRVFSGPYFLV